MENRRLLTFLLTSLMFLGLWSLVIEPRFFPQKKRQPAPPMADVDTNPVKEDSGESGDKPQEAEPVQIVVAQNPVTSPVLGSLDPDSGYALQVRLTSAGASIRDVALTSPQFKDLQDQKAQAVILGTNLTSDRTCSLGVLAIDRQLREHNQSLETANWKLVSEAADERGSSAIYEYDAPDGTLRIRKTFHLPRLALSGEELAAAWRSNPSWYTLQMTVDLINLSDRERTLDYELQGPTGILLENPEHTYKYRDLHLEFLGGAKPALLTAAKVYDFCRDLESELGRPATRAEQRARLKEDQEWTAACRYAGVDVQFFAALLAPLDNRSEEDRISRKWIDRIYPVLIEGDPREPRASDISLRLSSMPLTLKPRGDGDTITHQYALFVGPKRSELLDPEPMAARAVLNYGWFGPVARVMMFVLDTFHRRIGMPYFLAIISLTVLVRGCLFPISRKQAISAARMKDLQPQITALKTRYGDDREKLARAQMELWRKNKINPLGGCLPLTLQLPVFIGLYTALNASVDLRLKPLLWIENLAGPDALFRLPFEIPFFGLGADVSILPICTVALFMIQQKLFMPPAQDEQSEMTMKIMQFTTPLMGFMFWHQPAGLSIYFIASSLWSIAERTLLSKGALIPSSQGVVGVEVLDTDSTAPATASAKSGTRSMTASSAEKPSRTPGFLQKLLDAAQTAREQADRQREREQKKGKNSGRGK